MKKLKKYLNYNNMKHSTINLALIVTLFGLVWSGCKNTGPVALFDEQDDSKLIELKSVGTVTDSLYLQSGVDSTGLFGAENMKCYGRMIFTGIRFGFPVKDSLVQAEAVFLDSSAPILHNGRLITYASYDVGTLSIDNDTFDIYPRRIKLPMMVKDTIIGYQYKFKKAYSYHHGHTYHWKGSGRHGIGSFNIPFIPPPEIRITGIVPQYIRVTEPLCLKWDCANQIVDLVISREGGLMQRTWAPVLHLRIQNVKSEITIPTKILEILPIKQYQKFLFTFVSDAIPPLTAAIGGYGNILIRSTSIHNVVLNVQQ